MSRDSEEEIVVYISPNFIKLKATPDSKLDKQKEFLTKAHF